MANVAGQQRDDRSILALFRALIALRREHAGLRDGRYRPIRSQDDVLAFARTQGEQELIVALNIAAEPRKWSLRGHVRHRTVCQDE